MTPAVIRALVPLAAADPSGELNEAQRRAVEHGIGTGDGPLLVIAGAGSGKTPTLAHRVAHLVARRRRSPRILLMTFSRRAAAEMERRVAAHLHARRLAPRPPRAATPGLGGTFHASARGCCANTPRQIGLDPLHHP